MGRWSCSGVPIVKWCPLVQQGRVRLLDFPGPPPQEGKAALTVPNALAARAFVHAEGFAYARVKHYLNDVGPITGANALKLFLRLFADQLASTKKFM